jgi:hypothetical protein
LTEHLTNHHHHFHPRIQSYMSRPVRFDTGFRLKHCG